MKSAEYYIEQLNLQEHPEGGFYAEVYRSTGTTPTDHGDRNHSTAIYFLLRSSDRSVFHRLRSDEIWHHYDGAPGRIITLHDNDQLDEDHIGLDLKAGQRPQVVIPANTWFAAEVLKPDSFILVGCTVSPGFDFQDFEMANKSELIQRYPSQHETITRFT